MTHYTAVQNVELPLLYSDVPPAESSRRARDALDRVGLSDRFRHRPYELSGGERQRVAIARAIVNEPQILFADEPTGNLDTETGHEILGLFKSVHEAGRTIVMVTHDLELAEYATRTMRLRDGKIEENDP